MAEQLLFDKLTYMDRLTRAGIDEAQARAHAEAMEEALRESVATKADIAALKADMVMLKTEMAMLKTELKGDIAALKHELTLRMGVIAVALFAALATIKFFG